MQFKQAEAGPLIEYNLTPEIVIPYRDIVHPDGLIRVEYYHSVDVSHPNAFNFFKARSNAMRMIPSGGVSEWKSWKTIVVDSVTSVELAARKYDQKVVNPVPVGKTAQTLTKGDGVNPKMWWGASTDALEDELIVNFQGVATNIVLACHIDERTNQVSGEILRGPNAPGRLSKRGELSSQFQEQYHQYTQRYEGVLYYQLGTQNDGQWVATTQIDAPHPCVPRYEDLWVNWQGERPPMHMFVYGDSGSGKSTFLATFPKPMLVFMFDGMGKDLPFWKYLGV